MYTEFVLCRQIDRSFQTNTTAYWLSSEKPATLVRCDSPTTIEHVIRTKSISRNKQEIGMIQCNFQ